MSKGDAATAKVREVVETVRTKFHEVAKKLHDDLDQNETLRRLAASTHVKKEVLLAAALIVFLALFFFEAGARFVSNVVGYIFPAYSSFRSIEENDTPTQKVWLSYWIVFGLSNLIDQLAILQKWIPFYYLIKLAFVVFLWHPKTKGAVIVRDRIEQFIKSHPSTTKTE